MPLRTPRTDNAARARLAQSAVPLPADRRRDVSNPPTPAPRRIRNPRRTNPRNLLPDGLMDNTPRPPGERSTSPRAQHCLVTQHLLDHQAPPARTGITSDEKPEPGQGPRHLSPAPGPLPPERSPPTASAITTLAKEARLPNGCAGIGRSWSARCPGQPAVGASTAATSTKPPTSSPPPQPQRPSYATADSLNEIRSHSPGMRPDTSEHIHCQRGALHCPPWSSRKRPSTTYWPSSARRTATCTCPATWTRRL